MNKSEYGVIWDLDGVLFDTIELHYLTWLQTLQAYDVGFNREMFKALFGMKNDDFLVKVFGKGLEPEFITRLSHKKEQLFREMSPGRVHLLPGAHTWLTRLKEKGIRQAIASSAPQANVDTLIDLAGIRSCFKAIVSSAGLPGKPDPAVFLKAAQLIGMIAELCIVVEDAVVGVEAARRAGMKCIAVTTSNPAEALADADLVVDRLDLLPSGAFDKLLGQISSAE